MAGFSMKDAAKRPAGESASSIGASGRRNESQVSPNTNGIIPRVMLLAWNQPATHGGCHRCGPLPSFFGRKVRLLGCREQPLNARLVRPKDGTQHAFCAGYYSLLRLAQGSMQGRTPALTDLWALKMTRRPKKHAARPCLITNCTAHGLFGSAARDSLSCLRDGFFTFWSFLSIPAKLADLLKRRTRQPGPAGFFAASFIEKPDIGPSAGWVWETGF